MNKGEVVQKFCGKGCVFLFEHKEDRDIIFWNGPYFMGPMGMYLTQWNASFDPEKDIPKVILVWVKLSHLPLHYLGDDDPKAIQNTLGKFIDRAEPKPPIFSCAKICVEVDLAKGFSEEINLTMEGCNHLQKVDYEKIPFKCNTCYIYGHFSKVWDKRKV